MLPRSQIRKYSLQETLSPGNTLHPTHIQEALIQGQVLALPPNCERESFRMFPCETHERHTLHVSLWDIRETDASILGRGCIQHQVLCAIPFNINMIQVCKKWRREKLKSEQSIHSSPMMNFNFESESEQALTMRKNVTIGVNWPFIRLLRIILPDWIELM